MKKTFFQKIPVGYALNTVIVMDDILRKGWSIYINNTRFYTEKSLLKALLFVRWYYRHS